MRKLQPTSSGGAGPAGAANTLPWGASVVVHSVVLGLLAYGAMADGATHRPLPPEVSFEVVAAETVTEPETEALPREEVPPAEAPPPIEWPSDPPAPEIEPARAPREEPARAPEASRLSTRQWLEPVRRETAPRKPASPPAPPRASSPAPETPARPAVEPRPDFVRARRLPSGCPEPEYPRRALRRGLEGTVVLEVDVDAAGDPTDVRVLKSSGHGVLDRAARDAVTEWHFSPARRDGRPVASKLPVRIRFVVPR